MCDGAPSGVAEALGMLDRSLTYLATADAASLPAVVQAGVLRGLERAEARHTALTARRRRHGRVRRGCRGVAQAGERSGPPAGPA